MNQSPAIRVARLVHPFPSFVNAGLVLGLSLLAGADLARSSVLAVGMLGLQFCIGVVNDLADEQLDALTKPWKPIASGLVSRRDGVLVALLTGGGGLVLAASAGLVPAVLALAMLGAGLAYDLRLKPTAWAWLCFAVAFPLLPIYAWYGAVGMLPPRAELLLPLAALAAPALQLSNGLADLEADRLGGIATLATRLGRRRTLAVMAVVLAGPARGGMGDTFRRSASGARRERAVDAARCRWTGALQRKRRAPATGGLCGPGCLARPARPGLAGRSRSRGGLVLG